MVFFQKNITSIKQIMASLGGEWILPILMTDQTSKYHILSQSEGELKKIFVKKSKLHRRWGYYWDEVSNWRRLLFLCRVNLERLLNEGGFNSDEGTITVRTVYWCFCGAGVDLPIWARFLMNQALTFDQLTCNLFISFTYE